MPAKLDDWTEKEFGIKNPKNQPPKAAEEEGAKVRVVADGEEDIEGDDREADIEEIKDDNEESENKSAVKEEEKGVTENGDTNKDKKHSSSESESE